MLHLIPANYDLVWNIEQTCVTIETLSLSLSLSLTSKHLTDFFAYRNALIKVICVCAVAGY